LFPEGAKAEGVVALGEPDAIVVAKKVAVVVRRSRESEGTNQQQLAGRGLQQIGSTDDFRNLHGGIIRDDCELVGGHIVATPDDEVPEVLSYIVGLRSEVQVVEANGLAVGDTESPVHAFRFCIVRGLADSVAAAAGVKRLVVAFVGGRGRERQVLAGAGAGIDGPTVAQLAPCTKVNLAALALAVGPERSSQVWPFLPVDSQPPEIFEHRLGKPALGALGIEILVAQNQGAVVLEGALAGGPESGNVADVQQACGRRGKSAAVT